MRTYSELFSLREFRVLFGTQCLTVLSGAMGSLALGTITYKATGSPLLSALSMFGGPLVRLVGSWFLLSLSDLLPPRRAMLLVAGSLLVTDLLQAIPSVSWPMRFVLLAIPWLVMSGTSGTAMALMSEIVPADAFVLGRSTLNISVGVMQIVGYAAAGLLLLLLSTTDLFLVAALAMAFSFALIRLGLRDRPPRATGGGVASRTRAVNRRLLGSPVLRPVYLCLWVPNGLIVGCEALFVPFAVEKAGYLFAATAAGMLAGDIVVGRFVPEAVRDRLVEPLRFLLALPYLGFVLVPSLPVAAVVGMVASFGYSASLPLQERLVTRTAPEERGQVLGLNSTGMMVMQGLGAVLGGAIAELLGHGAPAAAHAVAVMAVLSVLVSLALIPGLRRSRERVHSEL
ncbi:MAG: MFS transporter [Nocardioidaceae bacterium]